MVVGFGDLFQPVGYLSVLFFLDGDVGEGVCGGSSVPVLFVGGEPHYVAGAELFYWAAEALGPAEAGGDDEGLAEGMGVPCGAGAG